MTTADLPVTAPTTGIVWAYRFRADGSAEPIANKQVDAALTDLHQEFDQPSEDLVRLRFVMGPTFVITARQRPVQSAENTRLAVKSGKRFPTAVSLLDAIIDQFADAISRMADKLGDELDAVEDHVMGDEPAD
jgi:zinc transporter